MNKPDTQMRLKLPDFVHEELAQLPGGKKPNAERLLIEWAKREKKKRGVK